MTAADSNLLLLLLFIPLLLHLVGPSTEHIHEDPMLRWIVRSDNGVTHCHILEELRLVSRTCLCQSVGFHNKFHAHFLFSLLGTCRSVVHDLMVQLILLLLKCSLYSVTFLPCTDISVYSLLRYTVRSEGCCALRLQYVGLVQACIDAHGHHFQQLL
jgi:hypothetical protein